LLSSLKQSPVELKTNNENPLKDLENLNLTMRDMWKLNDQQLKMMKIPKKTGGDIAITMIENGKVKIEVKALMLSGGVIISEEDV